jgi:hypothetical protein
LADPQQPKAEQLFNGENFDGWYVYTTETQSENPGIFQVDNGTIYVPGGNGNTGFFGGLITKKSYDNYCLEFEYKWGDATYGNRKDKARDAGVLLHCIGPNGPGPWMTSYEYQIIEGGTGDLLVVNNDDRPVTLQCSAEAELRDKQHYFKPGGETFVFDSGRLNWWGRDPTWKDEAGIRGPHDLESPHGQWNKCKIVAHGNTLEFYLNGKLVNKATDLNVHRGKILFQTEGAEVWYRNLILTLLDASSP